MARPSPTLPLGRVPEGQGDLGAAEAWYHESLAISVCRADDNLARLNYTQLSIVAQALRDFDAAEAWYRKALAAFEGQGDTHSAGRVRNSLRRAHGRRTGDNQINYVRTVGR